MNTTTTNPDELLAAQQIGLELLLAIKNHGDQGVPSGTLYAVLMGGGCTKAQYDNVLDTLVRRGIVTHRDHIVRAMPAAQGVIDRLRDAVRVGTAAKAARSLAAGTASGEHPDRSQPIVRLRCCCCGASFRGRQFHNQDVGFGLGDCCVEFVSARVADVAATYGIPGVHFRVQLPS